MDIPSILYLDDEADNLISFKAVFRRNYRVFTALNVEAAEELLKTNDIQVVISDQRMPGMSGVAFLSQISQQYPHIIRMILTGYSDMQAIIDAINNGKIYYYLTKPWKHEELKVIIDKAVETYILRKRNIELMEENHALLLKNLVQEKAQLASQYEVLKNQINPHFLFNSLNTLVSLIGSDPNAAIKYTTKFAKMYRLVLAHGEEKLITVEKEMDFLNTYIHLQQIRFGNNLSLEINIYDTDKYLLPPYALQLLIENVIKHNVILAEKPMNIEIQQQDDFIFIKNKIHKRQSTEISTGIGLQNLNHRYQLICGQAIEMLNDGVYFTVKIPLIPQA